MPQALRVRLLVGATVAIFLALAASWIAMTLLFERHIERRVEMDLRRIGLQLAANTSIQKDGAPAVSVEPGDALFEEPASGVYWQLSTPQGAVRSRSLWDQELPPSSTATAKAWSKRLVRGPHEPEILLIERRVVPERSATQVLLQLGHESQSLHKARSEFGEELASFLAILWLILSAAAWAQVELGLRPLRAVRSDVEKLKRNSSERLRSSYPREIEPLTRAINELAEARAVDLNRARRRSADLAHGLKTPLAALSAQSRRAREAGAIEAADGLDRAIAAAAAAIEGELARSRAAAIRTMPGQSSIAPLAIVESVIGVVERTETGANVVFDVDIPDDLRISMASEDLLELMGTLIENAARFARRRVRIGGSAADRVELVVEDDGPGIEAEQMAQAMARGVRLDEAGPGHGLGLSIAQELAQATGGTIQMLRSELGGLKVVVSWSSPADPP